MSLLSTTFINHHQKVFLEHKNQYQVHIKKMNQIYTNGGTPISKFSNLIKKQNHLDKLEQERLNNKKFREFEQQDDIQHRNCDLLKQLLQVQDRKIIYCNHEKTQMKRSLRAVSVDMKVQSINCYNRIKAAETISEENQWIVGKIAQAKTNYDFKKQRKKQEYLSEMTRHTTKNYIRNIDSMKVPSSININQTIVMNNTRKSLNNENSPLRSRKGSMISNNEKSEIQSPTKFHNDLNSSCESPGLKTINEFHFKPKDSFISNQIKNKTFQQLNQNQVSKSTKIQFQKGENIYILEQQEPSIKIESNNPRSILLDYRLLNKQILNKNITHHPQINTKSKKKHK